MKDVKTSDGAGTDGEQRGLLIRDSLVTESLEMTADLWESIIHVPPPRPHTHTQAPLVPFVLQRERATC